MKTMKRILGIGLALAMVLALTACGEGGSGGASVVGIWEFTDYIGTTIEQGKLATAANSTVVLFSDNTYILSLSNNAYYSSDGGETYNPTNHIYATAYGTYEITSEDAELGEKTMKFSTIDRVVVGDYDTDVEGTDEDKEIMASSNVVGMEVYLTSDGRMSGVIDLPESDLFRVGPNY